MASLAPPGSALSLVKATAPPHAAIDSAAPLELGRIAYENHHAEVFHAWVDLGGDARREALRDRYVFLSVANCIGGHLGRLIAIDREGAHRFVEDTCAALAWLTQGRSGFTEEWFHGLEQIAGALGEHSYVTQARAVTALGLQTGAERFPRFAQALAVHAAHLDALMGRREDAAAAALRLVNKPYLLPNRRDLPRMYQRLMVVLSGGGHLAEYREVLWKGLASRYARGALRDAFVEQIAKTYRGVLRAALCADASWMQRMLLLLGNAARLVAQVPPLAALRAHLPLRGLHTALLYLLDRLLFLRPALAWPSRTQQPRQPPAVRAQRTLARWRSRFGTGAPVRRILVTRAMGGLGDVLMMTPGLQALARRWPRVEVDFAVPRSFHALLGGLRHVRLLDINTEPIDLSAYQHWVNLTDCPAGRVEAHQFPNVRHNRIEIFARAMGVSRRRLARHAGFVPFYRVTVEEAAWAAQTLAQLNPRALPVIGLQPFAADTYRNWPHMRELAARLAERALVLVFHHEDPVGFDGANIVKVVRPLRQSAALLARCERVVVPDSSFLHLSAALGIPAVAIFGAISGRVRTRSYPNVRLVAPAKSEFPCYPCWRHEHKPCHLTNGRESICLRSIGVERVADAVQTLPQVPTGRRSFGARFASWLRYGRE
jgi:ADP-heptose:LPS heptosyltransferase